MKTLTREIMMERIKEIKINCPWCPSPATVLSDREANDILSLFIEFAEELIGEDETEEFEEELYGIKFKTTSPFRNELRSDLRQKLEELRGKPRSPLDGTITVDQAKSYYATINGKCAWCGKDAKDLPISHYQEHDRLEKEGKQE